MEILRKIFPSWGEEKAPPSRESEEEVFERTARRKSTFMKHLDRISTYQGELTQAKKDVFLLDEGSMSKGASVALQILAGTGVALSSPLLRGFVDPVVGAAASFFGTQVATHGYMEWRDYIREEPREKVKRMRRREKLPQERQGDESIGQLEDVSERSLREDMVQLQLHTLEGVRSEIISHSKRYSAYRAEYFPEGNDENKQKYLEQRVVYMDRIIVAQEQLLSTMGDAYILSSLHEKERNKKTLGLAAAAALLEGTHSAHQITQGTIVHAIDKIAGLFSSLVQGKTADLVSESAWKSLLPTFVAMASGFGLQVRLESQDRGRKREIQRLFHLIAEEIEGLKKARLKTALRICQLMSKRGGLAAEAPAPEDESAGSNPPLGAEPFLSPAVTGLTEKEKADTEKILEQWRAEVRRIVDNAPHDMVSPQTIAATASPSTALERGALTGFLAVTLPRQRPGVSSGGPETPSPLPAGKHHEGMKIPEQQYSVFRPPVVLPPSPNQLLREIEKQTIQQRVFGDIARIIRGDASYTVPAQEQEMHVETLLLSFARSGTASSEALEGVLLYIDDLNENLRTISPKETIKVFFGADFFEKLSQSKKILEEALWESEQKEARIIVRDEMPSGVFRTYILRRYGMGLLEANEEITREHFGYILHAWRDSKEIPKINKDSLIRFLVACRDTLTDAFARSNELSEKESLREKRRDIRAALGIIHIVPEQRMHNPKEDERGFLRDLQSLCDDFTEQQGRAPEALSERIEALKSDRSYIFPSIQNPGEKDPFTTDVGVITLSDFKSKQDPTNLMTECGTMQVDPRFILGSFTARPSWIIDEEQARIEKGAREFIGSPTVGTFRRWFVDSQTQQPTVELVKISHRNEKNEEHSVYLVRRGHEYVAMAKLVGAPIVANVITQRQPNTYYPIHAQIPNLHMTRYIDLKVLQGVGLISAEFSPPLVDTVPYQVAIQKTAVPGLFLFPTSSEMFFKLYEQFRTLWPGVLERETLVDGVTRLNPEILVSKLSFRRAIKELKSS